MNRIREKKTYECIEKGYKIVGYTHPTAIVLTDKIGTGNLIMEGAIIGNACEIGDGNLISYGAKIGHNTTIGNFNFIAGGTTVGGEVEIKNNCMLGFNCTLKNGICINNYTLIGAAAYINRDTEEACAYVPARSYKLEGKKSFDFTL